MVQYIARRVRFRNGERVSVLKAPNGLPVHEVTLYVDKFRRKGRAANTIHGVCMALALLYRELASNKVDLFARLGAGEFLAIPELDRLASAAQYRVDDLDDEDEGEDNPSVINLARARFRRHSREAPTRRAVDVGTQATRLRYMADFLEFAVTYVSSTLAAPARSELKSASERALAVFRANIPKVSKRAKLNARVGLSTEEADRLLAVVKLDSPDNPWKHEFVRRRNWLIIVLLLATGMRRGELLGLQVGELPLWVIVLTRLLFACGGRVSQYASLKIIDFSARDGSFVLNLPQAKTREAHARSSFKEFDVSPQTGRLIQEYVSNSIILVQPSAEIPRSTAWSAALTASASDRKSQLDVLGARPALRISSMRDVPTVLTSGSPSCAYIETYVVSARRESGIKSLGALKIFVIDQPRRVRSSSSVPLA